MKKLVLFGDSLFGQSGKHRLEMLEAKLGGQYDVYNCAAGGWDTNDLLKKAPYIISLNPEVFVLSVGTNDAAPWRNISLDDFRENLKQLLPLFHEVKVIYFLPMPIDESRQPAEKQRTNELQKQYHDVAQQVCEELQVALIPSWEIFLPMLENGDDYLIEDGTHLNDRGYDVIYSEVARILHES